LILQNDYNPIATIHIAKSLKMPTHNPKLIKEYGSTQQVYTIEKKARKPNNMYSA